MGETVHISVRNLVEFLLREGDIDNRGGTFAEAALMEGASMHRVIQKKAGAGYRSEVSLKNTYELDDFDITLEGRADGVFEAVVPEEDDNTVLLGNPAGGPVLLDIEETVTWIDEIKTTYRSISFMEEPAAVHMAQAMCYAAMYSDLYEESLMGVRISYCHLDTKEMKFFCSVFTYDELAEYLADLLNQYEKWLKFKIDWEGKRNSSIRPLEFPYDYRVGQKELAANVYRTVIHRRKLFLEAPTGTGKTLSTLYPAVKAVGEGHAGRIFYLTAKTVAAQAPQAAVELMREHGLVLKDITLTSKERICILDKPDCNPDACPRAAGHYDRINEALYEIIRRVDHITREKVEEFALKYNVCPFELSLDISLFCDLIIGDYNYVFDPHASLKRFFGNGTGSSGTVQESDENLFLIDEAHNLVERGRDMFSASLIREDAMKLRRSIKGIFPPLEKQLNAYTKAFLILKKKNELFTGGADQDPDRARFGYMTLSAEEIDDFVQSVMRLCTTISELLESERKRRAKAAPLPGKGKKKRKKDYTKERDELRQEILEFYFELSHFLLIYEGMDEHYRIYTEETENGGFMLKLFCVDPSECLKRCMEMARSSILFSATFLPIQYYKALLGGSPEDYEIYANSGFDYRRQKILLLTDVTSRYRNRGFEQYDRIARGIAQVTAGRHGNYLVFLPSHAFLSSVADIYEEQYAAETTVCLRQKPAMTMEEREEFLSEYRNVPEADSSVVGFCVLGGIFGEGIDLVNDRLIGVIVVGTGIPQVCSEREILKEYFDSRDSAAADEADRDDYSAGYSSKGLDMAGYDYAYRFPGMNKVMQAAGRVIRTARDVGIVALFDDRFITPSYRKLFPREWKEWEETTVSGAASRVEKFWNEWL